MSTPARRRQFLQCATAMAASLTLSDLAHAVEKVKRPATRMPVIFIGHGSPMNAIRDNEFTRRLQVWGRTLPPPTAILSVSAHWLSRGATGVHVSLQPKTIHDFDGFPAALQNMEYPAKGSPEFASMAADLVRQTQVVTTTQWGLDHGTWTVLHHLYPKADVPVFQMSVDYEKPAEFHYAVGRDLDALRDKGVLVLGSGNVAHNLRATDRGTPDGLTASRPWAQAFDDAVKTALAGRDDKALIAYAALPGAQMAVATPDHYFPFLYALGAARANDKLTTIYEGFQSGTLSMRCVQFG